jgi:hypothetical protein
LLVSTADCQLLTAEKIYGNGSFGDLFAEICDRLMHRMNGVSVERVATLENGDESRVERALEMKHVSADIKADDAGNPIRQIPEPLDMLGALGFGRFGFVFPADNMRQHFLIVNCEL